jgi:hypothetical protein
LPSILFIWLLENTTAARLYTFFFYSFFYVKPGANDNSVGTMHGGWIGREKERGKQRRRRRCHDALKEIVKEKKKGRTSQVNEARQS